MATLVRSSWRRKLSSSSDKIGIANAERDDDRVTLTALKPFNRVYGCVDILGAVGWEISRAVGERLTHVVPDAASQFLYRDLQKSSAHERRMIRRNDLAFGVVFTVEEFARISGNSSCTILQTMSASNALARPDLPSSYVIATSRRSGLEDIIQSRETTERGFLPIGGLGGAGWSYSVKSQTRSEYAERAGGYPIRFPNSTKRARGPVIDEEILQCKGIDAVIRYSWMLPTSHSAPRGGWVAMLGGIWKWSPKEGGSASPPPAGRVGIDAWPTSTCELSSMTMKSNRPARKSDSGDPAVRCGSTGGRRSRARTIDVPDSASSSQKRFEIQRSSRSASMS